MKRRNFIQITSLYSGGLILLTAFSESAFSQQTITPICFQPHPLIKLCDDGTIVIYVRKQEMGQGVSTSLPMIAAEEMGADWQKIKSEIALFDYDNKEEFTTVSSSSIMSNWLPLRKAGAAAREMLITAAAHKWNIDRKFCQAEKGKIVNTITNQSISFKDLIEDASKLPVPENPPLKNYKDFKIIGKGTKRTNALEMVTGKAMFGIDIKLPGMLYALVLRSPVHGGKIKSYDAYESKKIDGVKLIIEITEMIQAKVENGIAVVADSFWAAQKARNLLNVNWDEGFNGAVSSENYFTKLKSRILKQPLTVIDEKGNAEETYQNAKNKTSVDFEFPFLAHATLEPINCTAWYNNGKYELWGGFQGPAGIADTLPGLFNIKRENLSINLTLMGGGFGRRASNDNVAEAMQIARSVEKPVKVYWTRVDDIQHDAYRPAAYHQISASLDENKNISSWQDRKSGTPFLSDLYNDRSNEYFISFEAVGGAAGDFCYPVQNIKSTFHPEVPPINCGPWRSVGYSYNTFSKECMIDELSVIAKMDPLGFRLKLLSQLTAGELQTKIFGGKIYYDPKRLIDVLKLVADEIGWNKPRQPGHFYGIACCPYITANSYAAHAFDITIESEKKITIHKVAAGIDCGLIIDPEGLKSQMEGALVWALSAVLRGEITLKDGIVQQSSFIDYGVLRFNEMPNVKVCIIDSKNDPGSVGEVGVPSVAPALCNAIFAATKHRIRKLPISKEGFSI